MLKKKSKINFFVLMITFFLAPLYTVEFSNIRTYLNHETHKLEIKANYTTPEIIIKDSLESNDATIQMSSDAQEMYSHKDKKFLKILPFDGECIIITDWSHQSPEISKEIMISYKAFNTEDNTTNLKKTPITVIHKELKNHKTKESYKKDKTETKKNETAIERILLQAKNLNFIFVALLVLILGIIMSFTPCIYPMIPITIAILGIDKQPLMKKIFSATLYVCGIALTFSIMGLLASSGKLIFGSLFQNSWFVCILIIFLTIMILNMLDITNTSFMSFNMQDYIPEKIQRSTLLPFFYGIFSGTISSPCVSPGLFALLTLVAEQGNLYIGAFWLFCFGIGLGLPLWIIAVLFGSENFLLKSGLWMIEIKEIFGLLLFIVLYRHASSLLGTYRILYILLLFLLFCIKKYRENYKPSYWFCSWSVLLGFIIIGSLLFNTYKETREEKMVKKPLAEDIAQQIDWIHSIEEAKTVAQKTKKTLLLDFTADWCTACKILDKKLFKNKEFIAECSKHIIFCKIDCTHKNEQSERLIDIFNVQGLPTIILINLNDEKEELKKFGSEISIDDIKKFMAGQND